MDRRLPAVLALTLSAAFLAGCASTPSVSQIPAKESADDCLILFPVEVTNKTSTTNPRKYVYEFSGDYGTITLPNASGFAILLIHEPGVMVTKLKTFVAQNQGAYGNASEYELNINLPYEPGKMIVAPFMFTKRIEATGSGGSTTYTNIVKAEDATVQEILGQAAGQKNAPTWSK